MIIQKINLTDTELLFLYPLHEKRIKEQIIAQVPEAKDWINHPLAVYAMQKLFLDAVRA